MDIKKPNLSLLKQKWNESVLLLLSSIMFAMDVWLCSRFHFFNLFPGGTIHDNVEAGANVVMEMFGMLVCSLLYFSIMIDPRKSRFRSLFLSLLFCETLLLFLDSVTWFIGGKAEFNQLLVFINCFLLILEGIVFVTFWGTEIEVLNLKSSMKNLNVFIIRIVTSIFFFMALLNAKFSFFFKIENGYYIKSKFFWTKYIYPLFICLVLLHYAVKIKINWKIKAPYIFMALLPVVILFIQSFSYSLSLMYISILGAIFVLYINVQVDLGRKIEEFRNKVMISQIQPHFMYNTLTTIKALCRVDPDLASRTITNFADYLRGNMDFASLESTIPLERELKHTKIYTEIEALRFDNITFEFKIEDENFEVPALVIQPMVENAVRHGVRSKKDGHVLVHTFADEKFHNIVIQDNGKGFDKTQFNGSRTHIGLLNTKLRIERLVNGIFEVESVPDKGVKISIKIPK
ncbi:MAG: histidine kinase [Treponema sp.]|nr:histidine kinase [Candidatus Treponema equifaecale]